MFCRYILRREPADPEDSWVSVMVIGKNPRVRHAEDKEALETEEHCEIVEESTDPVGEVGSWFGEGSGGRIISVGWGVRGGSERFEGEFTVSLCVLSLRRSDMLLMPSQSFWSLISVFC